MNALVKSRRLLAVLSVLVVTAGLLPVLAAQIAARKPVPAAAQNVAPTIPIEARVNARDIPSIVTQRSLEGVPGFDPKAGPAEMGTRAVIGDPDGAQYSVMEQTSNLTQTVGIDEITPFWTEDEQFVFFSKRVDYGGGNVRYQLFRTTVNIADPGAINQNDIVQITNDENSDFLFPVVDPGNSRVAFLRSGDSQPVHNPGTQTLNLNKIWHLYVTDAPTGAPDANGMLLINLIDATNGGRMFSLTSRRQAPGEFTYTTVQRPSWSGSSTIVFSAKKVGDANFHIYSVLVTPRSNNTFTTLQLTDGNASELNPSVLSSTTTNPSYIAFDANATAYTGGTPRNQDSPTVGNPASANAIAGQRNIFVSTASGSSIARLTTIPGTDNIQPSWSSRSPNDQLNPNGAFVYVAFSSTRRDVRSTTDPAFIESYTNGSTYDIYFVRALNNALSAPTPEAVPTAPFVGNLALKLDTSDPSYQYDDNYPTWPAFSDIYGLVYQSNRNGTLRNDPASPFSGNFSAPTPNQHDLFLSSAIDIRAPQIMRYDMARRDGEIVHINPVYPGDATLAQKYKTLVPRDGNGNPIPGAAPVPFRTPEQGLLPGTDVFFTVRVEDRESGVRGVYLQFKNPNSAYQQSQSGEHKEWNGTAGLFRDGNVNIMFDMRVSDTTSINFGYEYECQAISAADRQTYYSHINNNDGGGILYLPSVSDRSAFSGINNPPMDDTNPNPSRRGIWLKLNRLPDSLQDNTGGILYGAEWSVPDEAADWYIDVIAYDEAINPLARSSSRYNWIIYDNIWGFSTAVFNASEDILFVSDYTLGQKFQLTAGGTSPGSLFYGAESYLTDADRFLKPNQHPRTSGNPVRPNPYVRNYPFTDVDSGYGEEHGLPNALGVNSYTDLLMSDINRTRIPPTEIPAIDDPNPPLPSVGRYELWRTLARGPIPQATLQQYLPDAAVTMDADPDDPDGPTMVARPANRAVVWASTHTTDMTVGKGTILDRDVQDALAAFVGRGGRLFITGQNVGYGLTLGGVVSNDFFTRTLQARFISNGGNFDDLTAVDIAGVDEINGVDNRIAHDAFDPTGNSTSESQHQYFTQSSTDTTVYDPPGLTGSQQSVYLSPMVPGDITNRNDGSPIGTSGDQIRAIGSAYAQFRYDNGDDCLIVSPFPSTGGRVVYSSMAFESIGLTWYKYTTSAGDFYMNRGRRAEIMHNIVCSLRTATASGTVVNNSQGNTALPNVLVRAVRAGRVWGRDLSDNQGRFQIVGLPPGNYALTASKPGFSLLTNTPSTGSIHGGDESNNNRLSLIQAPNILLTGTVYRGDGVSPLAGVMVQARTPDNSGTAKTDITDAFGNYQISEILYNSGGYLVIANPDNLRRNSEGEYLTPAGVVTTDPAQAEPLVQGGSDPWDKYYNPTYDPSDPTNIISKYSTVFVEDDPAQDNVVINRSLYPVQQNRVRFPAGSSAEIDFILSRSPSSVEGQVYENTTTGRQGVPGAIVRAYVSGDTTIISETVSDAAGMYVLENVPEGNIQIVATKPGYRDGQILVAMAGDPLTGQDILMAPLAPGSISGLVSLFGSGTPPAGVTGVTLELISRVSGQKVAETTTFDIDPTDLYRHNYKFDSVPVGDYTVRVVEPRPNYYGPIPPKQIDVTVTTGTEVQNINFILVSPGSITGRVTDNVTGAPLEGVGVRLYKASDPTTVVATATTTGGDPDPLNNGRYTFTGLEPSTLPGGGAAAGNYIVRVDMPAGYYDASAARAKSVTVNQGSPSAVADFGLTPGGTITVTVTNSVTGDPVEGATVKIWRSADPTRTFNAGAPTDVNGQVVFAKDFLISESLIAPSAYVRPDGQTTGTYVVDVVPPTDKWGNSNPAQSAAITIAPGASVNVALTLDPPGNITGTVTEYGTNNPITQAVNVYIYRAADFANDPDPAPVAPSATVVNGQYSFSDLTPSNKVLDDGSVQGDYIVLIKPDEVLGYNYFGVSPAQQTVTVTSQALPNTVPPFQLLGYGKVAGVVRDMAGNPVAGAIVELFHSTDTTFSNPIGSAQTTTGAPLQQGTQPDGTTYNYNYQFDNVIPSQSQYPAGSSGIGAPDYVVRVRTDANGRPVDANGQPLSYYGVTPVTASAAVRPAYTAIATPMQLIGSGSISGVVTEFDTGTPGTPVSGVTVTLALASDPTTPIQTTTTNASGAYSFTDLNPSVYPAPPYAGTPAGDYIVRVTLPVPGYYGATPAPSAPQTVDPGENITGVDFQLFRPRSIFGTVTETGSNPVVPVQEATVELYRASDLAADPGASPVMTVKTTNIVRDTQPNGTAFTYNYRFDDVPPSTIPAGSEGNPAPAGGYVVRVSKVGYYGSRPVERAVTLPHSADVYDVDFTLDAPGRLSGLVTLVNSNPAQPEPGVTISAYLASDLAANPNAAPVRTMVTGDVQTEGAYQFNYRFEGANALAPGAYVIRASKAGSYGSTPVERAVTVATGAETQNVNFSMNAPGRITGLVTDLNTDAPVSGITIEVVSATDPTAVTTYVTTDPVTVTLPGGAEYTYNYIVADRDQGSYTVRVNTTGSAYSAATPAETDVTVNYNQDVRNINFELVPPGTISGMVTDLATGNPVAGTTVNVFRASDNTLVATTTTTDPITETLADGSTYTYNYRTPGVGADTYLVRVTDKNYYGSTPPVQSVTTVDNQDTRDVDFQLWPAGSITGLITQVKPGSIDPASGAVVTLYNSDGSIFRQAGVANPVTTGTVTTVQQSNGSLYQYNYAFRNLPPGVYLITATLGGMSSDPVQLQVTVAPGQETQNANIRMTPLQIVGAGMQLISLPYDYSGIDSRSIFGLQPGTAAYDAFTIADWTGADYRVGPDIRFQLGKGYFVRFAEPATVVVTGTPNPGPTFDISLPAGWSLIGHPFSPNIGQLSLATDVTVRDPQDPTGLTYLTMAQAVARNLVRDAVFSYTGSNAGNQYVQGSVIKPWVGYWFRAYAPVTLRLRVPATGVNPAAGTVTQAQAQKIEPRQIESKNENEWRVQVAARQGKNVDSDNSVGVSAGASDTFDFRYDTEKPPFQKETKGVYVSIKGKDPAGRPTDLTDSVRPANGRAKQWEFTVRSFGPQAVTVFAPNADKLPKGVAPVLVDLQTGKRVKMASKDDSYTYTPEGETERKFRLEVAATDKDALELKDLTQSRDKKTGAYRFSFVATQDTEVTATILGPDGKTVRTIKTAAKAGETATVSWDGKGSDGKPAPAGAYVLSLSAKAASGSPVLVKTPLAGG